MSRPRCGSWRSKREQQMLQGGASRALELIRERTARRINARLLYEYGLWPLENQLPAGAVPEWLEDAGMLTQRFRALLAGLYGDLRHVRRAGARSSIGRSQRSRLTDGEPALSSSARHRRR